MEYINLFNIGFILLIAISTGLSFKAGEKSGSKYMLQYLRDHDFLKDSGYIEFMQHVRKEKSDKKD